MQWMLVGQGCQRKNLIQSMPSRANQDVESVKTSLARYFKKKDSANVIRPKKK